MNYYQGFENNNLVYKRHSKQKIYLWELSTLSREGKVQTTIKSSTKDLQDRQKTWSYSNGTDKKKKNEGGNLTIIYLLQIFNRTRL